MLYNYAASPVPEAQKRHQHIKVQTGILFLKKSLHVGTVLPEGTMFAKAGFFLDRRHLVPGFKLIKPHSNEANRNATKFRTCCLSRGHTGRIQPRHPPHSQTHTHKVLNT
jgi:hypothetical protein